MFRRLWLRLRSLRQSGRISNWDFSERRELVRLRCQLEVVYSVGDNSYSGQIMDMSLGGMLLRCLQPPGLASLTKITYINKEEKIKENTVRCRVQWSKANKKDAIHHVGLSYCDSEEVLRNSWVKFELHKLGFNPKRVFQKRRHVRAHCFIPARIYSQDKISQEGRLYNLGASGALLESNTALQKGDDITLAIGPHQHLKAFTIKGRIAAITAINRLQFLGIEFEQPPQSTITTLSTYIHTLLEDGA